ncbi:MAG: glycine zipper 2TM domain-containing protein [Methylophilaceae bacterium]
MQVIKYLKPQTLVPALIAAVLAIPAMATDQYNDMARVISATPQTERVNVPRQECRTEYQQQSYNYGGNNNVAGAIIGGVAGGLLGNTIGKGHGRTAAAAVGAGVGALVGNNIANNNYRQGSRSVPVENCYQVNNWQTVNTGYLVTYEYNGRTYNTVTTERPGRYIDVNVAVAPQRQAVTQINYSQQYNGGSRWDDGDNHRGRHERQHRRDWDRQDDGRGYY